MATVDVVTGIAWTAFRITGEVRREDILTAINTHFQHLPNPNVIWDLSAASIGQMNRADFEAIALATKETNKKRENAKTAFVSGSPETFALVCMYTGLAVLADVCVDHSAFRSLAEAEQWIAQSSS
jgi:hypothetical protein